MAYNMDMVYEPGPSDITYPAVPTPAVNGYSYRSFPQQNFGPPELSLAIGANAQGSSVAGYETADGSSPNDDDLELKKMLRRIQNREAASRCRRKKTDRISFLRQSLHTMYARSMELQRTIAIVEAELQVIKSARYSLQDIDGIQGQCLAGMNEPQEEAAEGSSFFYPY